MPAVLGLKNMAYDYLSHWLHRPVVEVLVAPPSIPGMRLNNALTAVAQAAGVRIIIGSKVTGFKASQGRVTSVRLHQAGADKDYSADNFVYAGGGFESGSLAMDSFGHVSETLFDLPLRGTKSDLITGDYWGDQLLFAAGVVVDKGMRPVDSKGQVVYRNLYAVGGLLAGAIRWSEMSGDGIAVASAFAAAKQILKEPKSGGLAKTEGSK